MEDIFTVEEAAKWLKVEITTVRYWLRHGTLRGTKVGKTWRVPEGELRRISGQAEILPEALQVEAPLSATEANSLLTAPLIDYVLQATREAAQRAGLQERERVNRLLEELRVGLCGQATE